MKQVIDLVAKFSAMSDCHDYIESCFSGNKNIHDFALDHYDDGENYLYVCYYNEVEVDVERGDGWHSPHCEVLVYDFMEENELFETISELLPFIRLEFVECNGDNDFDDFVYGLEY